MFKALAALSAAGAIAAFLFCLPILARVAPADLAELGVAVALGSAVAFAHLRHAALGLAVALAPLPGLGLSLAVGLPAGLEAYGFGFAAGTMITGTVLRVLLEGGTREEGLAALPPVLAPLALSLLILLPDMPRVLPLAGAFALCAATTVLLLPAAILYLPFGETFFTRANRMREARARLVDTLSALASPRWSLSLAGVALVLAVVAVFEMSPFLPALWPRALVFFVVMLVVARDLRIAVAAALATGLLGLFVPGALGGFCAFAFFGLRLGASMTAGSAEGESAWRPALERQAATIGFAALGMALMLATISPSAAALGVAAAALDALVFLPALGVALCRLWPRRRSLEELYRA